MRAHRFAVGLLTELAPHEQPHLLGLNENAGQAILDVQMGKNFGKSVVVVAEE